ncbi:response regulator [Qipengyuania sp. MTN3-11]|uniref:response regulator n=1 Tax=Qipengyuania sp. MTN3-11 TaxID=3056557 RepID=UPI0036F2D93D
MQTFLVLEDEPLIAMDLKYAFEDLNLEAVVAADNAEAIACIEKHRIAGAILDVSLGGGETCQPTATELTRRGIPFLLHTGDLDRVGERLRDIDAPVIAKPRPSDDVVQRLLDMIGENA